METQENSSRRRSAFDGDGGFSSTRHERKRARMQRPKKKIMTRPPLTPHFSGFEFENPTDVDWLNLPREKVWTCMRRSARIVSCFLTALPLLVLVEKDKKTLDPRHCHGWRTICQSNRRSHGGRAHCRFIY